MQYVFPEPQEYGFRDVNGHHGKFFGTNSPRSSHLIVECNEKLTVSLKQHETEFNYYVINGDGYFVINDERQAVKAGDLIVVPPGAKYTFGGKLKMLLISTPKWHAEQEEVVES